MPPFAATIRGLTPRWTRRWALPPLSPPPGISMAVSTSLPPPLVRIWFLPCCHHDPGFRRPIMAFPLTMPPRVAKRVGPPETGTAPWVSHKRLGAHLDGEDNNDMAMRAGVSPGDGMIFPDLHSGRVILPGVPIWRQCHPRCWFTILAPLSNLSCRGKHCSPWRPLPLARPGARPLEALDGRGMDRCMVSHPRRIARSGKSHFRSCGYQAESPPLIRCPSVSSR